MQPIITENREKIAELCRTHHVRRLSAFGSAVRDDFDPVRSDVDLVEFEPLAYPLSVTNCWELEEALTAILARPADLLHEGTIRNPYLLSSIRNDQKTLYAA